MIGDDFYIVLTTMRFVSGCCTGIPVGGVNTDLKMVYIPDMESSTSLSEAVETTAFALRAKASAPEMPCFLVGRGMRLEVCAG